MYRVTLASSHLNRITCADTPQHSSRSQSIHDAIGGILALAKLSQIKTPDLFSVPAHCSVTYNTGHSKNTARSGATPTPDGLSLVISPCVQGKSSRSPSRSSNEQCVEILQAVVRWSLGQEFVVENLAIERHTRLASLLCEAIEAGTSGGPSTSSDRLQHMGDCRDGERVGEDRKPSQEGVLSLVAWLMRRPSQGGRKIVGNETRERGGESLFRVTLTAFALELSRITGANIPQHSSGRHRIYTCRRGGSCTGLGHILPNKDSRPLFCSSHLSHRLSYGCRVIVALLETPLSTGQMMCSLHVHSGILDVVPNWHYNSI